jgi:hypothetical protein
VAETTGIALRCGFQREAIVTAPIWPTASAAVVTTLLPLLDVAPTDGVTKAGYSSVASGLGPAGFDVVSILPAATVTLKAQYQGLEALWACALGYMAKRIGATVLPEALGGGAFRHLYELDTGLSTAHTWDASADGFTGGELLAGQRKVRRGTFAVDLGVSVWEFLSSMVQALTLQVEEAGATLTLELLSHSKSEVSVINTSVTMARCLPPTAPNVLFSDLLFRVAPYSASTPLASGDIVRATRWALRLDNMLVGVPGPRTGLYAEEYERGSDPRVTVTFVDPRHTADQWQQRWRDTPVLMADARCTSERFITAGQPYRLNVSLPSCQVTNAQLGLNGATLPPDTVQLVGVVPSAAAAGFPTMRHTSSALAVEVYSGVSQHPLL